MSLITKLFGRGGLRGKAGERGPSPSPQEALQKLWETEGMLTRKQEVLESKISHELLTAKKYGSKNRMEALLALKRKKRYENQLSQIDGTLSTIEFQREALQNASINTEVLKNMAFAAKAMKSCHEEVDIDKADELIQDITEQQALAQEISDAIWKFKDEDELDELLAELHEMEELDKDPLESLPNVPSTSLPARPATKEKLSPLS